MKANRGMVDLEQKITLLKNKLEYDLEILKTHFHYSYESLKGATKFFFNKFFH